MHPTDPVHEAKRSAFDTAVERLAHHQAKNGASDVLNLTEAAKRVGVSRGRLYRAIDAGRLDVMPGGGPGKPTMISRGALETFALAEGLQMPDTETMAERSERTERLERSIMQTPAETERLMERLAERLAERLTEDLRAMLAPLVETLQEALTQLRPAAASGTLRDVPPMPPTTAVPSPRTSHAEILPRLLAWRRDGVSGREMARRLNAEGRPTVTGRGHWTDGQIGRMLRAHDAERHGTLREGR